MKRLFERGEAAQVRAHTCEKIENILAILDAATALENMNLPGFWAVTIRANWRIIWRFDGADAVDVDLIDYH